MTRSVQEPPTPRGNVDWMNAVEFKAIVPPGLAEVAILGHWSKDTCGFTGMKLPYKIVVLGGAQHFDVVDVLIRGRSQHPFVGGDVSAELLSHTSLPTELHMDTCGWGEAVELVVRSRSASEVPLLAILYGKAIRGDDNHRQDWTG